MAMELQDGVQMRKKIVLIIVLFTLLGTLSALFSFLPPSTRTMVTGLIVSSDISGDEIWYASDSPVYITDNITIQYGASLVIESSVDVLFDRNVSLTVRGSLHVGSDAGSVNMTGNNSQAPGFWKGVLLEGSAYTRWNNVNITGAEIAIGLNSSNNNVIRNVSFHGDIVPLELSNGSTAHLVNSALNFTDVGFEDDLSVVETSAYVSFQLVNFRGAPESGLKLDMYDSDAVLKKSHIVNSTGVVPADIYPGRSLNRTGWNDTSGLYLISLTNVSGDHYTNTTHIIEDCTPQNPTYRYFHPPDFVSWVDHIEVEEDLPRTVYPVPRDNNGAGSLEITTDSTNVVYNRTRECLTLLYTDESVLNERVNVTISDGVDEGSYSMNVTMVPRDDPLDFRLLSRYILVRENTPYDLGFEISDEDTPMERIGIISSDPENTTVDISNLTISFLYGDGTDLEFNVTLTASDGNSSVPLDVNITFQPVNFKPYFVSPPPPIQTDEDEQTELDIGPYILDPDEGDVIRITASSQNPTLFGVSVDGTVITISPYRDMNGVGKVRITLEDLSGYSSTILNNVTVDPVNDPPTLVAPSYEVREDGYRFNVTYSDMDGDLPDYLVIHVDGEPKLNMTYIGRGDASPVDGMVFAASLELRSGKREIEFLCSDGEFIERINLTLTVPIMHIMERLEAFEGMLSIDMSYLKGAGEPGIIEVESVPAPQNGLVWTGCAFRIDHAGLTPLKGEVEIEMSAFRRDVLEDYYEMWVLEENWTVSVGGTYTPGMGIFCLELGPPHLNSTLAVLAPLDPEYDGDGDGYPDGLDAFPDDPNEYRDTDSDGIGDNRDQDDDNDSYNDTFELEAKSDPRDPSSIPADTDMDGLPDIIDEDDDNDGIPDAWEEMHGLNKLDPSDADWDPDGDGLTNLEEYRKGTDPNVSDNGNGSQRIWSVMLVVLVVLVILLFTILGIYLYLRSARTDFELEEASVRAEADREWEIQGELDAEDAVECLDCEEIYPNEMDACPFCGSRDRKPVNLEE